MIAKNVCLSLKQAQQQHQLTTTAAAATATTATEDSMFSSLTQGSQSHAMYSEGWRKLVSCATFRVRMHEGYARLRTKRINQQERAKHRQTRGTSVPILSSSCLPCLGCIVFISFRASDSDSSRRSERRGSEGVRPHSRGVEGVEGRREREAGVRVLRTPVESQREFAERICCTRKTVTPL